MNIEGFILIGGKSSRMGKDKFALKLNDKTFLQIVVETLEKTGIEKNFVVVSEQTKIDSSFLTIKDIHQNRGALSGIHSALVNTKSNYIFILACDYPFVSVELINYLRNIAKTNPQFEAIVPIQSDGKVQPLCAVYKTENCRNILSEMLKNETENYSVRDFLDKLDTNYVGFNEISHLPNSANFFFNVNMPKDFEKAKIIAKDGEIEILKMTPNDISRILEIQLACGLEGWSAKSYEEETYRTDSFSITAKIDGEIVGYLIGRLIKSEWCAELYNIGVDPRFQRKKVGNAMLKEFIEFCTSENMWKMYLEVRESNESAIQFYLKHSFTILSKRKNFYKNPTEDAILMVKELLSTKHHEENTKIFT